MLENDKKKNTNINDTVEVKFDDDILRINFLEAIYDEDMNTQQAQIGVDKALQVISQLGQKKPVRVIVNLVTMNSEGYISKDAREIYVKFVSNSLVNKVAVIGSSSSQIAIANFVLSFNTDLKAKLSWFSTEIEAKYWVKK